MYSLTNADKSELELIGKRDASDDHNEWDYLADRICSTNSYLSITTNYLVKAILLANSVPSSKEEQSQQQAGQFTSDRFIVLSSGIIIGCNEKPFALDSTNFKPLSTASAMQCADVLCQNWTNADWQNQVAAVSDNLKAIAIQTKQGAGWKQFATWNLEQSDKPHNVEVKGDTIELESVQVIKGKVWILFSSVIGGAGSSRHDEANLADETGTILANTEMFGRKPICDSTFDRVIFVKQDESGKNEAMIHIKIWHPKQNKEEVFDIDASIAMQKLYDVWKK